MRVHGRNGEITQIRRLIKNNPMNDSLFIALQKCMPQHAITKLMGRLAFCETPWLKNAFIQHFIQRYDVDLSEAAIQNIQDFRHFNDFFTRRLKPGARPIGSGVVSPCDGLMSQWATIEKGSLIQAKGHSYSAQALLTRDTWVPELEGGVFSTIYLSPKDYHRVHMPLSGRLEQMIYVPGDLYSVNLVTADHIPNLFARNERVVCVFRTPENHLFVMVLVGAMIVGSMATAWAGTIRGHQPNILSWTYENTPHQSIGLEKGEEMGFFHVGSTVVLLLSKSIANAWNMPSNIKSLPLKMGESLQLNG